MTQIGFGLSAARAESADEWLSIVRRAEDKGYEVLHVPDHLGALSPTAAMAAAAMVTERIRLGAYVLNNDFRHPLLVAQEATSLDLLSNGRLELGLGAGWNVPEYEQSGIAFDKPSTRIERLEESAAILCRLFAGEEVSFEGKHYTITGHTLVPPPPQGRDLPITIGGNGDRLLTVAARYGDVVGLTGFTIKPDGFKLGHFSEEGLADRIDFVKARAGDRFAGLELSILVQHAAVTDDADQEAHRLAAEWAEDDPDPLSAEDLHASPFVLIGTVEEILAKADRLRASHGISRFTVFAARSEGFDDVAAAAAGERP